MLRPYIVLSIGLLVASSSAILIMLARAEGVPAMTIAALRLTFASLALAPFVWTRARGEWARLAPRDVLFALASGVCLALHFAFWISSLDYTSVMSSVVFVSTNPIFVGLASVVLLREQLRRGTVIGIVTAIIGGTIIALTDLEQAGTESLQGNLLALAGAVTVSAYLLIGRRLRKQLSLLAYIGLVYTTAAIVLLAMAFAMGANLLGYTPQGYLLVVLLAAGPQLIGHTSYNWALKYVSATFVTVTLLAEPIGATLLAIPILAQVPTPVKIVGGALILLGIYFAAREETEDGRRKTEDF
ncbi:MAG: DMT family transporter [Anaerolineae bacterium]|nr:DMT family transporter [Anaerolineae bacterium]